MGACLLNKFAYLYKKERMHQDKTLHVFDMDDTLVKTPKLEDVFYVKNGSLISGDPLIDSAIDYMIKLSNEVINKEKEKNNRMAKLAGIYDKVKFNKEEDAIYLYINDKPADEKFVDLIQSSNFLTDKEKEKVLNKLEFKDGKLILKLFSEFFQTEGTVGIEPNEDVVDIYENVKNKMILTGRSNSIYNGVHYILFHILGLSKPNFGLFLYNGSKGGVPQFKSNVIKNSIERFGWTEIHFYEDRKDWLGFVESQVLKQFTEVRFFQHHIL